MKNKSYLGKDIVALDILKDIGTRSGVFDRRALIGILFPIIVGMFVSFVLSYKKLPDDLNSWIYLIVLSITITILINELSPRICWRFSRVKSNYFNYLNKYIDRLFIEPSAEFLSEYNINEKAYEQVFEEAIPDFVKRAREDYYENYFIPSRRYSHEKLILNETRIILCFSFFLMALLNLFLTILYSLGDISIVILTRDKITTLSGIVGSGFFIITLSFLFITLFVAKNTWKLIVKSTNTPYQETEHETDVRESTIGVIKDFQEEEAILAKSLEPISQTFIRDEFAFRVKRNILMKLLQTILQQKLKIGVSEASVISKKISEQAITDMSFINEQWGKFKEASVPIIRGEVTEPEGKRVAGGGILISKTGLILTTWHLATPASVITSQESQFVRIESEGFDFPKSPKEQIFSPVQIIYPPKNDEEAINTAKKYDLALLQIVEEGSAFSFFNTFVTLPDFSHLRMYEDEVSLNYCETIYSAGVETNSKISTLDYTARIKGLWEETFEIKENLIGVTPSFPIGTSGFPVFHKKSGYALGIMAYGSPFLSILISWIMIQEFFNQIIAYPDEHIIDSSLKAILSKIIMKSQTIRSVKKHDDSRKEEIEASTI